MEKSELLEIIKELIKTTPNDSIDINENYLQYFEDEELINIINSLREKKRDILDDYLDEIYQKSNDK